MSELCGICKKPLRKVKIKANLCGTKMTVHKQCCKAMTWMMKGIIKELEKEWE